MMKNSPAMLCALAVAGYAQLTHAQTDNSFNPQISLILDGTYAKPPAIKETRQ